MALEKQLADTDSVYCTKVTNSNQSSIFISNLGDPELNVLFGEGYKSDDKVRLSLDKRNLAFNAVAHVIEGRTWYKRKTSEIWGLNSEWLNARLQTLSDVFASEQDVFVASLNKDDHSTQRLYMKGMTSLSREDGNKTIALRDFLFSGDVIVLTKLDNGDVSFEVKIPDNPIVKLNTKEVLPTELKSLSRQLIVYGAPGTGKSWRIKNDTAGKSVIRTTFHPDSDYSTFVGAYKPSMEADEYDTVVTTGEKAAGGTISKKDGLVRQKRIVYKFVAQAFLEAYVKAWRKCAAFLAAQDDNARNAATQFLVIEEINRGNCAQIFGDIFQLLDREDDGYSSYAIKADTDLCQYLKEAFDGGARDDIAALNLDGINLGDRDVTPDEIKNGRKLLLPPNLYIWATMNTSDQSLFPIDSAFKRRWDWKYMPIYDAGKKYRIEVEGDEYDWWNFLEKVNKLVEDVTSSEDKKLGYFFCKAGADGTIPLEKFVGKVIFYLWNSVFKDTEFEGDVFDDGNSGKLLFKTFFNPDGSSNAANVKKFMANLGVTMVSQEGETSHDAE